MYRMVCDLIDWALAVAFWLGRRLIWLAWRCRAGLVPAWTAVVVAVGGGALRTWASEWWWAPVAAAIVAAPALFWFGDRLTAPAHTGLAWLVPDWLDDGRRGVLDRPTERGYLAILLLACCGWASWLALYGWPEDAHYWFGGFVLVLGAPWWWHRGFRRRKRPNRWASRWRHVGESIKEFDGSKVIAHSGDRTVTELKVVLRPGLTINSVGDRALQVASALSPRLRPGAVTLAGGNAARQVSVRIVPRDPWKGIIPHPLPPIGSVDFARDDRVLIGRLEDQRPLLHRMRQHTLVIAKSGGGKSVMGDALLAWMVISRSPVAGIDMASGVTLGEWEPCLAAPLATNAPEAMELLRGVMNVVEYREREMKRLKVKTWPHGDLFVVMDEFPSLIKAGGKQIVQLLTILAERARKTGVWLYALAQNGTKDDVGSTEFRAQMMATLGGRLDNHMNKILWGELTKQGWDGTGLQTGTWLLRDATRNVPRAAKGAYLSEAEQIKLVRAAAARDMRAGLDAGSLRALRGDVPSEAMGTTLVDVSPVSSGQVQPRRLTVIDSAPSPLADLDARILGELPDDGQGSGVGASGIAVQLDVDRGRVERALRRMEKDGRARHTGARGGWVRGT